MKNIAIIDTETTGLDARKGQVLEIACIYYNIPSKSIIHQISTLIGAMENPVFDINKIPVDALKYVEALHQDQSIDLIGDLLFNADAIVAHNAEFDRKWINTIPKLEQNSRHRKWICTRNDVTWPLRKDSPLNLIHIAANLGVPIINAHRALSDCHLLLSCLEKVPDMELFLDHSISDKKWVKANIRFDDRPLAKAAGFLWDNDRKYWHKKCTIEEIDSLKFSVEEIF